MVLYLIFALSTAATYWYYIWNPNLKEAIDLGIKNELTEHPYIANAAFFFIGMLTAPIVAIILVLPGTAFSQAFEATKQVTHEEKYT